MPKTGLKTFVYSFCISLFTIFTANGVYWHGHPSNQKNLKIPTRNITLFLRGEQANPSKMSAPVKKIALNILPELQKAKTEEKDVVYQPEDEIIMADNVLADIPLEFATIEAEAPAVPPVLQLAAAEPLPHPKTEAEHSVEDKHPEPPSVAAEPVSEEKLADIPLLRQKPQTAKALPETAKDEIKTAAREPTPLFPLEKSGNTGNANDKVRIGKTENLNQVALADKNVPIQSMKVSDEKPKAEIASPSEKRWQSMAEKEPDADNPWIVAKGAAAPKNNMVSQQEYYNKEHQEISQALNPETTGGTGVQVAAGTVKNLLIPIPEDILQDEDLTPQLVYPPEDASNVSEKEAKDPTPAIQTVETTPVPQEAADKKNILTSLNSIFNSSEKVKEKPASKSDGFFAGLKKKLAPQPARGKIMPTEMRLSFQPNRAEISGQTLRWIQAFAAQTAKDNHLALEIRIDGTSAMELQQKRLNLLHNILTNKGVEYSKINTVFTNREPNSFIIRTITLNNVNRENVNISANRATQGYYQQW